MKSIDVRNTFLEYFKSKEHEIIRSSSLIPKNDPTLLFSNAGMIQFKSVFLGDENRPSARATTCQKCMRAGGKHNDLENVGHTARHHTFFEMLGNFSFGDYFKADAIHFGWELLTERYKLPIDKLWISIFDDDDEAEELWLKEKGVTKDRIVRMGAKDNFWQMADTGPCGPCSEIHIDQGAGAGCGKADCKLGCECDRFLELWNLVFMQFNRDEHGTLHPLPSPSIDTGMGLERITAVLQGKQNNYDTDLFSQIGDKISQITGVPYGKSPQTDISIRVIMDHTRAAAFLLSDGLMPANDGRGYVLRRIIRRASRHARLLGIDEPMLYKVLDAVIATMGDIYPELISERVMSARILKIEEERFDHTLKHGMKILDDLLADMDKKGEKLIPGAEIFKLYDTFGFPVDLVRDIALDSDYQVDEQGFTTAMEAQRELARASWVGQEAAIASIYREVLTEAGATEFTGYDSLETEAVIKAIIVDGKVTQQVEEGGEAEVILDRTPFYGESGGQAGDKGTLLGDGLVAEVTYTKRPLDGLHVHYVKVQKGTLKVWDAVRAKIDTENRDNTKRNHTATHLLQAALRSILGEHVKQAGSLVEPERLRFDFTHFSQVSAQELSQIEAIVNENSIANIPLVVEVHDVEEAIASGAMALFGEKYGDKVRVINIADISKELCGGTHCSATGEIGPFVIDSEGSVASGIRRIEAFTGKRALAHLNAKKQQIATISNMLKNPEDTTQRVEQLLEEIKILQKDKEKLMGASMKDAAADILDQAIDIDGIKVLAARVDGYAQKDLRDFADKIRDRIGSGVIVLGSAFEDQAALVAMVTKDLTKQCHAGNILKQVAASCNGRGGGKPDMAQGGTKELEKLDTAIKSVYDLIKKG